MRLCTGCITFMPHAELSKPPLTLLPYLLTIKEFIYTRLRENDSTSPDGKCDGVHLIKMFLNYI